MKRSLKSHGTALLSGIAMTLAAFTALAPATPAFAQNAQEAAARTLVLEAWTTSHAPELYADARRFLHDVMIPIGQDFTSGKLQMLPIKNPTMAAFFNEYIALFPKLEKAAVEFDAGMAKNREEFIDDMARILAKHLTPEEIEAARGGLQLTATRKGFDALYKLYGMSFSFTYPEAQASVAFSVWAMDVINVIAERKGEADTATPSPERLAKATAIVNELITSARIDDMVADGLRFGRQVVMPFAPNDDEKAKLKTQLDTLELQYTTQKPVLAVIASAGLAQLLNEEQLNQLQQHMRGPGIDRMYKELFKTEQAFTAFTVSDIQAAKTYVEGVQAKGLFKERSAEQKAALDADMKAFGEKWGPKLIETITPETRDALMQSFAKLEALSKAMPGNGL